MKVAGDDVFEAGLGLLAGQLGLCGRAVGRQQPLVSRVKRVEPHVCV